MLGPTVNAAAIIIAGLLGTFLIKGISPRFEEILRKAIGLSILVVGIKGAFVNERILLFILSMVTGAIIGEILNIDAGMKRLGIWAEQKLGLSGPQNADAGNSERSFSKGFVSASILFCSGSMAILGSIQSGLLGNHEVLFAKSVLDASISVVFAASMGIGVVFSSIPVFVYQAGIALGAMAIKDVLTPDIVREMSAVGSLVIAAIGFNFLGVKEIRVANLIPAIFIPLIFLSLEALVK